MAQDKQNGMGDELQTWIREQLDLAVKALGERQIFDDALIELKPAWALPHRILVGKIRAQNDPTSFKWFICGEVPLDHLGSGAASTPREAVRHFAMKWQLDAERMEGAAARVLIEFAENVYPLADDDRLWAE